MTAEVLEKAKSIYFSLQDDVSKEIFLKKLRCTVTDNGELLVRDFVKEYSPEFFNKVEKLKDCDKKIIIYGAGVNLPVVLMICKDINIYAICDRDETKQQKGYGRYRIMSPEELFDKHKDAVVLVSTTTYWKEVMDELGQHFTKNQLVSLAEEKTIRWMKSQYFAPEIMKFSDDEVFVDGGCFDFETSQILLNKCKVKKIYAFEPDEENYKKVQKKLEQGLDCEVELIKKGLWDKETRLSFQADATMCSYVVEGDSAGNAQIEVTALDQVIHENITFIKMDIEGSELRALQGAKRLIQQYKPKLAISIYHKPEDTIDIPYYIHELVPEYRFYIRHYSYSPAETILYAVI